MLNHLIIKFKKNKTALIKQIFKFNIYFFGFYFVQNFIFNTPLFAEEIPSNQVSAVTRYSSLLDYFLNSLVTNIKQSMDKSFLSEIAHPFVITILLSIFLIIFFYFLGIISKFIISRYIFNLYKRIIKKEEDKEIFSNIANIISPFFILIGIQVSIILLEAYLNEPLIFLRNSTKAILIFTGALLIQRVVSAISTVYSYKISKQTELKLDAQLLPIFLGLLKAGIISMGILLALSSLGLDITPIIASLGAFTFALGFAVKDSLSNFVAGIFLIFEKACAVGDKVDIPGIGFGYIHEIGLRTTKLRTFNNEIIIIPNNGLMNKEFKNYRMPDAKIRVVVPFSISYGSNIEKAKKIVLNVISKIENTLEDPPPVVEFLEMADFSLNFEAKFFVGHYNDQYDKQLEAVQKIYNGLNKAKISIPFPTYTVELKKS